jgi:hypothetical protein
MRDDSWNRDALASGGANQSVVHIDVDAKATHSGIVAFLSPMLCGQFSNENQKSLQS